MFIMKKLICLATLILFGTIIVPSVTVLAEDTSSVSSDGITEGERLAKIFDSNGNGWVALYKQGVYRYKGAPLIGYQHRTF